MVLKESPKTEPKRLQLKSLPSQLSENLREGGVKKISSFVYDDTWQVLKGYLEGIVRDGVTYTEHTRRKNVAALDVIYTLKRHDRAIYGFEGWSSN